MESTGCDTHAARPRSQVPNVHIRKDAGCCHDAAIVHCITPWVGTRVATAVQGEISVC